MTASASGAWGPTVRGGRRRGVERWIKIIALLLVLASIAAFAVGASLYRVADQAITRVPVPVLEEAPSPAHQQNFLIVGSDSRDGLTDEQLVEYTLGVGDELEGTEGQRSDTVILVSILAERTGVNVVSFPRDLYVLEDGAPIKLTEAFFGGPNNLVDVVSSNFGLPINHYVEVSVIGFISAVDAVGFVTICLEEPLVDPASGADFSAGCHDMGPKEALSYVRSRRGRLGDFERITRQQKFMRALVARLTDLKLLVNIPNLFRVVDRVGSNITFDDSLGLGSLRSLADEARGLAEGDLDMIVVPGYVETVGQLSFVLAYEPGLDALVADVNAGRQLTPRGTAAERAETRVAIWSAGRTGGADLVERTLNWGGYRARPRGEGQLPGGEITTVYSLGNDEMAAWVAAHLGAEVATLPDSVTPPGDVEVLVVVGNDAGQASLAASDPSTARAEQIASRTTPSEAPS